MRSHRQVLRQIAEQNLDPKIAYVKGTNGSLVPKKHSTAFDKTKTKDPKEDLEKNQITSEEITSEKVDEETKSESSEVIEEKPKKKFPPKKKKTESSTDE
jgi:hypothetical protein